MGIEMVCAVFDLSQKMEYKSILQEFSLELDIYYDYDFLECDARLMGGTPEVFVVRNNQEILLYPYIRLPFLHPGFEAYTDISSPYGYAGPFTNSTDVSFLDAAEAEIVAHLRRTETVTEFVRYHYLYNKDYRFRRDIVEEDNRTIVLLPLNKDWESIWMHDFSSLNRNLNRKMQKEGYLFEEWLDVDAMQSFFKMYHQTMENVNAGEFYFFNLSYFILLQKRLKDKIKLYRVVKDGDTYACSLFFFADGIVTYFLSARNLNFPKVPATNFLLAKMAEIANKKGMKWMNLGGGNNNDKNNSLFKFKRNFSSETANFKIGKRVINPEVYKQLKESYIREKGLPEFEEKKNYLQFYR